MDLSNKIKVVLAHELPLLNCGLQLALRHHEDLELHSDWDPTQEIINIPSDVQVLVTDLHNGMRAAGTFRTQGRRSCHVMVIAPQAGEWEIRQAVHQGVQGLHMIDTSPDRLAQGLRNLARGHRSFDDSVAIRLADCLLQPTLTERERDVLDLIVQGACNKEIARLLDIALGTVKAHVRALLDKLDVKSRAQAMVVAKRRGIVAGLEGQNSHRVHAAASRM